MISAFLRSGARWVYVGGKWGGCRCLERIGEPWWGEALRVRNSRDNQVSIETSGCQRCHRTTDEGPDERFMSL
jgi:hypothetical protein